MQFQINRDVLLKSLSIAHNIIERKNTLPILSNVLLEIKKDKLNIVATDLDILFLDEIFKFELNYKYKFFIILFLVIIILSSAHSFLFYSDSKPIKSLLLLTIFLNSIVIFYFFKNFTFSKILNLFKFSRIESVAALSANNLFPLPICL